MECTLNLLAEKAGISYWDIRDRNVVEPGDVLGNGQIAAQNTAIRECLAAVKPYFESSPRAGLACAWKNSGLGVGVPDAGRMRLVVRDGGIRLFTSAACMGQGVATTMVQIASFTTSKSTTEMSSGTATPRLLSSSSTPRAQRFIVVMIIMNQKQYLKFLF